MKFIILFLFLFTIYSCEKESLQLRPMNEGSFVKIDEGTERYQVIFDEFQDIQLIETDRILNDGEYLTIELLKSYNITAQQTQCFEYGIRVVYISAKLDSPLYIAFH